MKSGDWTPRLLAWARAHAAHPKHPLIPIALQRGPEKIVNTFLEATGGWVSGHSLKHVLAAGAAWPVMATLGSLVALRHSDAAVMPRVMPSGQNGAHAVGVARRSGA